MTRLDFRFCLNIEFAYSSPVDAESSVSPLAWVYVKGGHLRLNNYKVIECHYRVKK